jgi:CHAT domain-containing protein/tetratricopeptide (TPR) repeat protein
MGSCMSSSKLSHWFRPIAVFFALSLFLLNLPRLSGQSVPTLELRKPVERALVPREMHTYRLYAHAEQYLQIDIQPQTTALTASLLSPAGEKIAELLNRPGDVRLLRISVKSEMEGYYRVQIGPRGQVKGKYNLALAELREIQPMDLKQIDAQRAFHEGRRLRAEGSKTSLDRAIQQFEAALPLWHELNNSEGEASTLMEIGSIYLARGDANRYTEYETRALTIWRALGDRGGEGETLNNLGLARWARGEKEDALEKLNQALPLRRSVGDIKGEAETLRNLGTVYAEMGDLQRAIPLKQDALERERLLGDRDQEAGILNDFAVIYDRLGQNDRALDYFTKALAINRQLGNRAGEAVNLVNISIDYERAGDARKALETLVLALKLFRESGNRTGESVALQYTGKAYAMLADHQQALQYYEQALTIQKSLQATRPQANTTNLIAQTLIETGDTKGALALLDESLELARRVGDRIFEADTLAGMARAYRLSGDLEHALARIEESVQITETVRGAVASADLRSSYLATAGGRYDLWIDLLMESGRRQSDAALARQALEVSERARARGLLDLLSEAGVRIREGVDPDLLRREQSLLTSLDDKSQRQVRLLTGVHTAEQASSIEKEIRELTLQYQEVESEVRARSPRYAALTQPQPLKVPEIQELLDSDTLILEYALGEERSFLWVVGARSLDRFVLPKRVEIEAAARKAYEELSVHSAGSHPGTAADALSRIVLDAAAPLLRNKRLVMITDGALQYIPLAALRIHGESGLLIENHEIVHVPSASVLSVLRKETSGRKPAHKLAAIFADPVFDRSDPRVGRQEHLKPSSQSSAERQSENLQRSAREIGLSSLPRLRGTRQEAEAIAHLAGETNTLLALDFTASRKTATSSELADYRIVHFATHGLLNSQHPELSGLILSLVDRDGQPANGFLESAEIYNLKLGADMVVLSACQTALGKDVRGEGLIGLTRGFMYAGAPRVLATLWPVPDQATTELMKLFYQSVLIKGMRPAAALQAAQMAMRGNARWSSPYYWAGFVLQGEWK